MMRLKHYVKISSMDLLFKVGNIFGLFPLFSFKKSTFVYSLQFRFYSFFILCAIIGSYIFELDGRLKYTQKNYYVSYNILQNIELASLNCANILTILQLAFFKTKHVENCIRRLLEVDEVLLKFSKEEKKRDTRLILDVIIGISATALILGFEGYVTYYVTDWMRVKYYIAHKVQYIYTYISIMFIRHFAVAIYRRLKVIEFVLTLNDNLHPVAAIQFPTIKFNFFKSIANVYLKICAVTSTLNNIFEWMLTFLFFVLCSSALETFYIIIALAVYTKGFVAIDEASLILMLLSALKLMLIFVICATFRSFKRIILRTSWF